MEKHENAKKQLILREVIKQLENDGDFESAERGRQEWLQLKNEYTILCGCNGCHGEA
tara:strand:+ start:118 stop:288 length:171 start_codon:yes stop_codon:yes gene_type:complete